MSPFVMPSSANQIFSALVTATPPIVSVVISPTPSSSCLALLPGDLARTLVGAQPEERGLPQLPVGGPFGERDLSDKHGLHPRRVLHAGRGLERRVARAQAPELRPEVAERVVRVARAHLAGVPEARSVEETDEERAELGATSLRRRVSADDEL